MTMRHLYPYLAFLLLTQPLMCAAAPSLSDNARCDTVELLADTLDCDDSLCKLEGNAGITCEHITLRADSIVIKLTRDFGFNGAQAQGNVVLVDGSTVVRCTEVKIEAGRIQGKISNAHIQVFPTSSQAALVATNPKKLDRGRALQTIQGDIERLSKDRFQIDDGSFTLCDCGGDENPSWRLGASQVDVTLENRATLWWPRLELNLFGLGMVPVPLPTPVLSLPIQKRSPGLLAPSITFLRGAYPVLDIPVFIPLGQSYDITLTPGLRTDWGLHRGTDIATWAAPRLGARFRYAPIQGLSGSFSAAWTRDTHFTAARLVHLNDTHSNLEDPDLVDLARQDPRWGLRDRVVIQANQTWRMTRGARWNLQSHWVSDDYIQRDFSFTLADQVSQYLPSRTRLDWHTSHLLMSAQVDYLQRLTNGSALGGYSNTSAQEGAEFHRAPSLELWLRPQHLGHRFFFSTGLVTQRYGRWSPFTTGQSPSQWDLYHQLSFSYLNQVGPFQLKAKLGTHLAAVLYEAADSEPDQKAHSLNALPFTEVKLQTTLAKRYGDITHMVQPFLELRYILEPSAERSPSIQNPWLELEGVEQVALGVRQSIAGLGDQGKARLELAITQPFSLQKDKPLMPTAIQLNLRGLSAVQLALETSIDWESANQGPSDLRATAGLRPWTFLRFFAQYGRLSPGSEVLGRSIYEISDFTELTPTGEWMHYLRTGAEFSQSKTWKILYQTDVLLALPGDDSSERPQISNHLIRMGYRSPCECWGLDVVTQMVNPDLSAGFGTSFLDNMTVRVNLTIGDYTVGSL